MRIYNTIHNVISTPVGLGTELSSSTIFELPLLRTEVAVASSGARGVLTAVRGVEIVEFIIIRIYNFL